jgi:23S rRNA (guanosine2251-2'-O)-methyltransferase
MRDIVIIAHDIRSTHNVGSLFRTAEGIGVSRLYLTGYTPYPYHEGDERLTHIAERLGRQIHKTALGAEETQAWEHVADATLVVTQLRRQGYSVVALEQTPGSMALHTYAPPEKIALLLGREVEGIDPELLEECDLALEIPMAGSKESFNVVQAAAMALFHLRFS